MERLTKRYCVKTGGIEYLLNPKIKTPTPVKILEACQKLGKLEDLEEQIRIPLDIVVRIITRKIGNIFVISNMDLIECNFIYIYGRCVVGLSKDTNDKTTYMYGFSEFNKLWFLTRKEAEKSLDEMNTQLSLITKENPITSDSKMIGEAINHAREQDKLFELQKNIK